MTILYSLVKEVRNDSSAFKELVIKGQKWGMNINTIFQLDEREECTLLSIMLIKESTELISFLLEKGADPNVIPQTLNELMDENKLELFSLV